MTSRIHGLLLPLVFPAGVAPGEGGDYNILTIARNGKGEPVLRGTALAGACAKRGDGTCGGMRMNGRSMLRPRSNVFSATRPETTTRRVAPRVPCRWTTVC